MAVYFELTMSTLQPRSIPKRRQWFLQVWLSCMGQCLTRTGIAQYPRHDQHTRSAAEGAGQATRHLRAGCIALLVDLDD